jgi:hypothetical protein
MTYEFGRGRLFIDDNDCLAETQVIDGVAVTVHYDDIPESDITTVQGLRCTTPLRTVIDIATRLNSAELDNVLRHCLERNLFTVDEALERVGRPDIRDRRGARLVRQALDAGRGWPTRGIYK